VRIRGSDPVAAPSPSNDDAKREHEIKQNAAPKTHSRTVISPPSIDPNLSAHIPFAMQESSQVPFAVPDTNDAEDTKPACGQDRSAIMAF
jgi:hypothetical protein